MGLLKNYKVLVVFAGIIIGLILRLTVIHPFGVQDNTMKPTILAGDRLLSWRLYSPQTRGKVKRDRIYIFHHPKISKGLTLKRLIAKSGDALHLSPDSLIVNGTNLPIRQSSLIQPAGNIFMDPRMTEISLTIPGASDTLDFNGAKHQEFDYWVNLIKQENPDTPYHVKAVLLVNGIPADSEYCIDVLKLKEFPKLDSMPWYDIANFMKQIQEIFPTQEFKLQRTLFHQDSQVSKYIVKKDCFFVLGDNRELSFDSRYWGFLSQPSLHSRPFLIYWSTIPEKWIKINFSRLFKFIKET